jgi:hypothetical protein
LIATHVCPCNKIVDRHDERSECLLVPLAVACYSFVAWLLFVACMCLLLLLLQLQLRYHYSSEYYRSECTILLSQILFQTECYGIDLLYRSNEYMLTKVCGTRQVGVRVIGTLVHLLCETNLLHTSTTKRTKRTTLKNRLSVNRSSFHFQTTFSQGKPKKNSTSST